ncbi:hypothetical protein C8J57DRAFT_1240717 [Mycena rebaudengoi]|nr:hypothetical protein C8J57DRAFT_1240717 [Mycena rebaudengoi]
MKYNHFISLSHVPEYDAGKSGSWTRIHFQKLLQASFKTRAELYFNHLGSGSPRRAPLICSESQVAEEWGRLKPRMEREHNTHRESLKLIADHHDTEHIAHMKTLKHIYEHHTAGLNTACTMHQQHVTELEAKCTKLQHDLTILQRDSREEIRALMVQVEQLEHQAEARKGRLKRMFREILICEIKISKYQNGCSQILLDYFLTDQIHSDEDDIESVSSSLLAVASSDPVISPRASPAPQSSQPPRSSINEIERLLLDYEPEHQDANVGTTDGPSP